MPKTEAGYDAVVRRCTALRRSGRVPYRWLTDATRRGHHVATYEGAGDLIGAFSGLYRVDAWRDAAQHCEVWTESRSIAGVVEAGCGWACSDRIQPYSAPRRRPPAGALYGGGIASTRSVEPTIQVVCGYGHQCDKQAQRGTSV